MATPGLQFSFPQPNIKKSVSFPQIRCFKLQIYSKNELKIKKTLTTLKVRVN